MQMLCGGVVFQFDRIISDGDAPQIQSLAGFDLRRK